MLFLTYWFVLYLALFFPVYWLARVPILRLGILLVGSAIFHTHFAGPAGVLPIAVLGVATYLIGLSRNRTACWAGVALAAASLVFYKYTRFLAIEVVGAMVPAWKASWSAHSPGWLSIAPPLAISFFVFEFIHYLVDVARGAEPIRKPADFTLYAIFWPSIVAGPVKRYQEFLPALARGLNCVADRDVAYGTFRVGLGLVKKFSADGLTAFVTFYGPSFAALPLIWRWWFLAAVALRILLDFSGYSDMAIGFARMHGIRLPENFRWPYLATGLADFWRRWHVSLSLWIRDYIYIALGGSRCGLGRKVVNGLVAFGLCGLWHGAGWNFLVWGLYHGLGLAVAASYRPLLGRAGDEIAVRLERYPHVSWLLTLLFVAIGWLFFFYPLKTAWAMIGQLFGG
jgi:alginate O-acetyltransferase complex protein AlgI